MVRNTWPFKGRALCDIIDHKAKWGSSRPQTEVSEHYLTFSISLYSPDGAGSVVLGFGFNFSQYYRIFDQTEYGQTTTEDALSSNVDLIHYPREHKKINNFQTHATDVISNL